METNQKKCPACAIPMREIRAASTYGAVVNIEQCDNCGGLWFDDLEMYRIKMDEADNIDGINKEKLTTNTIFTEGNFHCPNDNTLLTQFKDSSFPASLHIDNCSMCGGFWMNRGEFIEFEKQRAELIKKNAPQPAAAPVVSEEDKKFNEQIKNLLASQSDKSLDYMANFSKFLSAPINPMTNRPFNDGLAASAQANKTIDAVFMIINILLRLFLKI